ncbi:uncharacterized protein [Macrobrachium rosenbergii]|uniref:uncharacterized protein isoform X2 n=1 Tax=Macrobrachium rosenbergii TaxID=79674 RepID=UPI0034D553E8
MLGCFFFLWISFCLAPSLATSDQGKDVESCFLYPVHDKTDSPFYDISGKGEHFVTVNHIFHETNVVQFLDEQGRCVVALTHNTSKQQVDCDQTFPSDGEYTTLVYRRLDDRLTAYKKNSLEYAIPLSTDIQKLRLTSYKMVNVAFGCPGSCYTFEKATIHWSGKEGPSGSFFMIYGRVKASSENWNLSADAVELTGGQNHHLFFDSLIPEVTCHGWFSLKFRVTLKDFYNNTQEPFHMVELLVTNPSKIKESPNFKIMETLSIPNKDLYLSFARSENVLWAVTCYPGKDVTAALSCKRKSDTTVALSCLPECPSATLHRESDCYSFEKGTIHINYTQVNSTSSFKIFGRKKPSPDVEHLLAAEVMMGQHMNITKNVSINNLDLEVVSNQWFQLEFHVSFGNLYDGNIYDFYKMELIVKNPLKGKQDVYNLTASTKDLYLDFSQSVNVLWAIPCIPGREALTSDLEIGPALQRQAGTSLVEHHYDYIDLTVLREQMAEEESNSRGNSVEQHGSSEGRKSHTSINSVYGLARTDETVDDSSNANETVNRANAS